MTAHVLLDIWNEFGEFHLSYDFKNTFESQFCM